MAVANKGLLPIAASRGSGRGQTLAWRDDVKSAWILVLAAATVAGGRTPACADQSSERPNRMAFAEAMGRVKAGMATNELVELVGLPDEKRIVQRGSPDPYGVSSIWCYGTDTNVSFPTLGCVYLDDNSAVKCVYGGFGPEQGLLARPVREGGVSEREDVRQIPFDERELRRLLQVVDGAPPTSAPGYDPLAVIRVANVLVGLGKEKALVVLQEYRRSDEGNHGSNQRRTGPTNPCDRGTCGA